MNFVFFSTTAKALPAWKLNLCTCSRGKGCGISAADSPVSRHFPLENDSLDIQLFFESLP